MTGGAFRRALLGSKKLNRSRIGNFFIFFMVALFAVYSLMPMVLTVSQSLKPMSELFLFPPRFFVRNPSLENFRVLFELAGNTQVPFTRYIFNTIFITVVGTAGHVVIASMCAYPLAKHNMPGRTFIFVLIVYSLMLQSAVTDIVNYQTMTWLNWLDTYYAVLIPAFGASLGMYIMRQFMTQIPDTLLEAARIDGAGEIRILWTIVMPNVKPAWLTLSVFSFQGLWNGTHATYIYREQLKSLPYALNQIVQSGIARAGAAASVAVLMMVVPIGFFILTQSNIIETMASSGLKE